ILGKASGGPGVCGRAEAVALYVADRLHLHAMGTGSGGQRPERLCDRLDQLYRETRGRRLSACRVRDFDRQDARFSCSGFSRHRPDARLARHASPLRVTELLMDSFSLDVAHMLAGSMVLVSFMLLYQDRMFALLNVFALHAVVLSASVAWQAYVQNAPHLYVPAAIALVLKGIIIPVALHRVVIRLGIHRGIETVVGIGPTLLLGVGLTALSMVVMLKAAET